VTVNRLIALVLLFIAGSVQWVVGYSMLTHEEIVDLSWSSQIEPLLRHRFPKATQEELDQAHAYAYGGCVIQDLGYYPFGSKEFSDLVHYVRSGDFVATLILDSTDLDEYAFALGALAHYESDINGHPAVNHAVALQFPKLRQKFGNQVTYEDDKRAHIRTEFGFDVVQVAKNRYTSDGYHKFIGFQVAKPLLERAFLETYGLPLSDVLPNSDMAIGTYRRSVSTIIPEMTRVALQTKHAQLVQEDHNFDQKTFLFRLSRTEYEKEWGTDYQRPGWRTRMFAAFVRVMPKVGPLRSADIVLPNKTTEDMFIQSVNKTSDAYNADLKQLRSSRKSFTLANRDFDTGNRTAPTEYALADKTYATLIEQLASHKFDHVTPDLRANVLAYYSTADHPRAQELSSDEWSKVRAAVADLEAFHPPSSTARGSESASK
jgi:hypothetical protein